MIGMTRSHGSIGLIVPIRWTWSTESTGLIGPHDSLASPRSIRSNVTTVPIGLIGSIGLKRSVEIIGLIGSN